MGGHRGGRRPKSSGARALEGNPGRRPPRGEPQPAIETPPCPSNLDRGAREEWQRIAPRLVELRVLSALDRATLAAYCSAWSTWAKADRAIGRLRTQTITQRRSGTTKLHPLYGLRSQAHREMLQAAVELGLTASSRSRVRAAPREDPADPSERFFAPRPPLQ
jgi:P27 family predicted phage terminase small subunit